MTFTVPGFAANGYDYGMSVRRRVLTRAASALVALALSACAHAAPHFNGTTLTPKPAYDFTLTDQNGRPFSLASERGREVVLFFGYTHCPDVCPATMAQLARVDRGLSAAQRARVQVLFVTVDPQRDSPPVMKRYVALFDPSFIGLTGSEAQLDPVFAAYHVWHQKLPGTKASGYLMAHSGSVYLIDPAGELRVLHDWTDPAPAIASDVKELLG
ncbi:MAG TPA: SCO family protein [Candidatus Sulfotelmatobacter sp.]|nr:SCO family protein [Candidatus Sulfotelmatobacter sp.]